MAKKQDAIISATPNLDFVLKNLLAGGNKFL